MEEHAFGNQRQFARVEVNLPARVRALAPEAAERLRQRLLAGPSVWALSNEAALRERANRANGESEALISQALLEIAQQVVRLRARLLSSADSLQPATLAELSGGGGRIESPLELAREDLVELHLEDDDDGTPPVCSLIEVIHISSDERGHCYGFRFEAIHSWDRDRLIRRIYELQRRALRHSRGVES